MTTLVKELEKADLKVSEYARGPAGKDAFVISIQNSKLFRTWQGNAEIDVHRDRRHQQAVINTEEPTRTVTRDVTFPQWGHNRPSRTAELNRTARARFPIQMGSGLRWSFGDMTAERVLTGGTDRWDVTIPVTCTARRQEQSLLVGMDEIAYFVSALPEQVDSVKEAHELLRPSVATKKGTLRQGEFFFVPVSNEKLSRVLYKRLSPGSRGWLRTGRAGVRTVWNGMVPRPLEPRSSHMGLFVQHASNRYAIGLIMDSRTGRHEPLILPGWHRVVRNREVVASAATQPRRVYWD